MIQSAEKDNFVPHWKRLSRVGRVLSRVITVERSLRLSAKLRSALIMDFANVLCVDVLFKCVLCRCLFRQWSLQMCFSSFHVEGTMMPNCGRKTREIARPCMVVDSYRAHGAHGTGRRRWHKMKRNPCNVRHQLHAAHDHCTVTVRHLDLGLHQQHQVPEYGAHIHSYNAMCHTLTRTMCDDTPALTVNAWHTRSHNARYNAPWKPESRGPSSRSSHLGEVISSTGSSCWIQLLTSRALSFSLWLTVNIFNNSYPATNHHFLLLWTHIRRIAGYQK